MKLWEFENKKVKIITNDGQKFVGIAYDYTSKYDNTPEIACISIENTEFLETEIVSIEVIE